MQENDFEEEYQYIEYNDFINNFIFLNNDDDDIIKNLVNDILDGRCEKQLFRRIYWFYFLGIYKSTNLKELIKEIEIKRNLYKQDKEEYINKQQNLNIQKLDPQIFHPLSSDDKNPWILKKKNEELNNEIRQDILRTHSDKPLFQKDKIRNMLNDILFVWSKKNPSISYKQGMNEILAIFFITIYKESISNEYINKQTDQYINEFKVLFDQNEIESDTYIIFDHFMNMGIKFLFISLDENKYNKGICKNILLHKCTHIFHSLLKNSDKILYNHLISLSIEPQIFLLRWIRLFFCREFQIDDTIILWDFFFSDYYLNYYNNSENINSSSENINNNSEIFKNNSEIFKNNSEIFKNNSELFKNNSELFKNNFQLNHKNCEIFPLIDYFAISMILFIRSFLLENDENNCLKRLFKYPPVENIKTLIDLSFKIRSINEKKEKDIKKNNNDIDNKLFNIKDFKKYNDIINNKSINIIDFKKNNDLINNKSINIIDFKKNNDFINNKSININDLKKNNDFIDNKSINITDFKKNDDFIDNKLININDLKNFNNENINIKNINSNYQEKNIKVSSFQNINKPQITDYKINKNNINNYKHINTNDLNFNENEYNEKKKLNITTNKLNIVINNLNILSFNLIDETHRRQLKQNILNLNEIYEELKLMEDKIPDNKSLEDIQQQKKNEIPIYY